MEKERRTGVILGLKPLRPGRTPVRLDWIGWPPAATVLFVVSPAIDRATAPPCLRHGYPPVSLQAAGRPPLTRGRDRSAAPACPAPSENDC